MLFETDELVPERVKMTFQRDILSLKRLPPNSKVFPCGTGAAPSGGPVAEAGLTRGSASTNTFIDTAGGTTLGGGGLCRAANSGSAANFADGLCNAVQGYI